MIKTKEEILNEEKRELRKVIVKDMAKQNAVVFFGTISIIGSIVTLTLLMQMAMHVESSNMIRLDEGDIYGLVFIMVMLLTLSVSSIFWFRKFRGEYLEHRRASYY